MTALLVKYCTNSFTVIWRGVLVNCLVPCYFFLFLSRSSVHGHAFTNSIAIFAHIVYTLLYWPFWNHFICESSHLSSRGTLSCFAFLFQCSQSVLRNLSFFMSRDFVSPCSVLTQKNKLPLICQCSLICCHTVFLRTSRQLGLLGWGAYWARTLIPMNPPPIIPLLQKALTATIHLSQAETMHIFHCPISNPNPTI